MANTIHIQKLRGDDGFKVISVRIRQSTLSHIDSIAQETNRSRNEIINVILEESLNHIQIDE